MQSASGIWHSWSSSICQGSLDLQSIEGESDLSQLERNDSTGWSGVQILIYGNIEWSLLLLLQLWSYSCMLPVQSDMYINKKACEQSPYLQCLGLCRSQQDECLATAKLWVRLLIMGLHECASNLLLVVGVWQHEHLLLSGSRQSTYSETFIHPV